MVRIVFFFIAHHVFLYEMIANEVSSEVTSLSQNLIACYVKFRCHVTLSMLCRTGSETDTCARVRLHSDVRRRIAVGSKALGTERGDIPPNAFPNSLNCGRRNRQLL